MTCHMQVCHQYCKLYGNYDNQYDDDSDDEFDSTDLGIDSGLILEYIYTKFSLEADYASFASNIPSDEFTEVFGKFIDQYEAHFNGDGKLINSCPLFDQESFPYNNLTSCPVQPLQGS
jgi:hypothetical protein